MDVIEAYETVLPESSRTELAKVLRDPRRKPDVITFTSSSTVKNFLDLLGKGNHALLTGIKLASIGPVTSETHAPARPAGGHRSPRVHHPQPGGDDRDLPLARC